MCNGDTPFYLDNYCPLKGAKSNSIMWSSVLVAVTLVLTLYSLTCWQHQLINNKQILQSYAINCEMGGIFLFGNLTADSPLRKSGQIQNYCYKGVLGKDRKWGCKERCFWPMISCHKYVHIWNPLIDLAPTNFYFLLRKPPVLPTCTH